MFRFSAGEQESIRKKASNSGITALLRAECQAVYERPVMVPETGNANWSHYYYCPDCSVKLQFDLDNPHRHRCPSCNKVYSGGLYDEAWVRLLNSSNCEAAENLGLLYLCTGKPEYARKVVQILVSYADRYPSYEVHGTIPYNGPGKANAQTLDESIFLRTLASAYDLVAKTMSEEERDQVKTRLFAEGLSFLIEHRNNQIHNHEVICNGAIGILALLLGNDQALDLAINQPYGLLYQLEHGVLEDGFWFECSTAYHFYALQNFLAYEKFARHTQYSHLDHPSYRKMVEAPLALLKEDLSFPLLNDTHPDQGKPNGYGLFEFAYKTWKNPRLLSVLDKIYETRPRLSIDSFFYGEEKLPEARPPIFARFHENRGLGVTVMRNTNDQYLLFRHGPYGGEHDHHDRLAISYSCLGQPVSEDLGTTGYGARLHYGYYKRTGTHNTVVIDEENQMPSNGVVLAHEEGPDHTFVDAQVQFTKNYPMPDSYTIVQWSEEAYLGVTMRRRLFKTEDYLIDLFDVSGVREGRSIDFVMHFGGKRVGQVADAQPISFFSPKEPFSHLSHILAIPGSGHASKTSYVCGQVCTDYYTMPFGGTTYLAEGPDNPSDTTIPFQIESCFKKQVRFANVLVSYPVGHPTVESVSFEERDTQLFVTITRQGAEETRNFPISFKNKE
jgi:hypothetical protein